MKELLKYRSENGIATFFEFEKGLLLCSAVGVVQQKGLAEALHYLTQYSKKNKGKVRWLLDISEISGVNPNDRFFGINFFAKDSPLKKLAILNPSPFLVKYFLKLSLVRKNNCQVGFFIDRDEAVQWLKGYKSTVKKSFSRVLHAGRKKQ